MDRTVDGRMAPALQSCNHKSTGLVNQKVERTKEEDVVPHEKVNGSLHADDSVHEVAVNCSKASSSIADAAGDNNSSKLCADTGSTPATAATCILTGLKDSLPTMPVPAIHIGQGDSAAQNVMNYNGWGDCKRVHSGGILQESNNISSARIASKGSNKKVVLTKPDSIGDSTDKRENENHHNVNLQSIPFNGDSTPRSPSPILQSRMQLAALSSSIANTVKFSGAASSSDFTAISRPPRKDCTETFLSSNGGATADDHATVVNHRHDENISLPSPVLEVDKGFGTPHQEPKALDYRDLLSSDLSKINMSDKLANTLQELAASLKGTHMPLNTEVTPQQVASSELNYTVNIDDRDPLNRSVKSLELSVNPDDSLEKENALKDQRLRVEIMQKTVVDNFGILNRRLNALKISIDAMRSCAVWRHATKEISDIASYIPSNTNIKFGGEQPSVSGNQQNTLWCEEFSEFWQKLFQNDNTQLKKLPESEVTDTRKRRSSEVVTENDKTQLKKEFGGERKLSGELTLINMDPFVQLTRVEDLKRQANMTQDKSSLVKVSAGILQKELKYVRSRCDPDLTDSSSDEEITEPLISKTQKWKALKTAAKLSTRTKFRKSFCKWVAERAEVSRRWTWLQSRISSLELNIRHQGYLYSQLRDNKGAVQLDSDHQQMDESGLRVPPDDVGLSAFIPVSNPCNLNTLVDNVHHQTSRLFNSLPPLSEGSPSPSKPRAKPSQLKDLSTASTSTKALESDDSENTCARVKQLHLHSFQNRKLIKITPTILASEKGQKPKTVPNDSFLMCVKKDPVGDGLAKRTSLILKAALHDHSYHAVISSAQDIPLSISMRAVMKSKRKWCKRSSPHKREKKVSRKGQKKRRKSQKKYKRSSSFPNHAEDSKRRKLSNQATDSGRKRPKDNFMDSDMDSPVVVGGFSSHQPAGSRATTPTNDTMGQSQNYWKKRKTSEQPYDINNIVIPHGLNSTKIEKLAYKEIQTPSWRMMELSPISEAGEENQLDSGIPDIEEEDTSALAFQCRHDFSEIIEKRKYMAFMEWSSSRRGSRGSRMGKIREPGTPDPESLSPLAYTPSPVSFSEGPFSITTTSLFTSAARSPAAAATSPTAKPGVATGWMSSHQNGTQPGTPPSLHQQHTQHPTNTSFSYSFSSPNLTSWQDGFGSRCITNDNAAPINRTLSDGASPFKNDQSNSWTWEMRTFPLSDENIRFLEDMEYAKIMLNGNGTSPDRHPGPGTEAGNTSPSVIRLVSGEKHQTNHARPASQDALDMKSIATKRRRTDSMASSQAQYDDTARHSDCSNASASSVRKNRKKLGFFGGSTQRKHDHGHGNGPLRQRNSSINSKHRYLDIRLSETDDSTTDSDSDSNSSDEDLSGSLDAGHIVDDFADPEWECPRPRERR